MYGCVDWAKITRFLGLDGSTFTWKNGRKGLAHIQERLDRVVAINEKLELSNKLEEDLSKEEDLWWKSLETFGLKRAIEY